MPLYSILTFVFLLGLSACSGTDVLTPVEEDLTAEEDAEDEGSDEDTAESEAEPGSNESTGSGESTGSDSGSGSSGGSSGGSAGGSTGGSGDGSTGGGTETPSEASLLPDFSSATFLSDLSGGFTFTDEPSAALWHDGLGILFTIDDDGYVTQMDADGSNVSEWYIGHDIEGLAVADTDSNFIYVGIERSSGSSHCAIAEFDLNTHSVTRIFDLNTWMHPTDTNLGLEGLTFVPDPASAEGGSFYAALQENAVIYKFELPIVTSTSSTSVTYKGSIGPFSGLHSDISDLNYDVENDLLLVLYDNHLTLLAVTPEGSVTETWTTPEYGLEGIAFTPEGTWYLANDSTGHLWEYVQY